MLIFHQASVIPSPPVPLMPPVSSNAATVVPLDVAGLRYLAFVAAFSLQLDVLQPSPCEPN
ncbi:hypothetical protein M407DRAFT_181086 [Tulasnella calospora MUT 4182]|uniref:Uncharacterized protein n=1 Tax=Tulasnella calospora MUT 4182 TaxID=1051891 RepID=A0A0C3QLJ2_9AGAM|nr:hypothetical protein M407DRAFT_181086 [Tulasnella calospora MUT 4182]